MKHSALIAGAAMAAIALSAAPASGMTRRDPDPSDDARAHPPQGQQARAATFLPATYDATARTVDLVLSSGSAVNRGWWIEELEISTSAIDTARVARGLVPLLNSHNRWDIGAQLGVLRSVRFEEIDGVMSLVGTAAFADTDAAREAEGMVSRGELRGVSIGYNPTRWDLVAFDTETETRTWRATAWELLEASLVTVPADPAAGVRSAAPPNPGQPGASANSHEDDMRRNLPGGAAATAALAAAAGAPAADTRTASTPAPAADPAQPAADPARAAPASAPATDPSAVRMSLAEGIDFVAQARGFGVDETQARGWATDMTPDAARSALLRAMADAQRAQAPAGAIAAGSGARVTHDARDTARSAMESALLHRFNPANELSEPGRDFRGMSLLEMGRQNLEANGERTRGLSRRQVAELMLRQHSTSDFPYVLGNVARATLRGGYEAAPRTFPLWMRRATVPDFKQVTRLQLGGAPSFLQVPEGGEFKMGSIGEAKEVYAIATYGRRISVTRQVIINDDVDAFTRIPTMLGRAAAEFESDAAYAPLIANPNMGDGVPLFHANHGNLAGSGAAPSESTLDAAEQAFAAQTGIEGRLIGVQPRFIIHAPKHKVGVQKLLTAVMPTATSGVNVYAGALTPVVEPRLRRTSGATPWYLAADPAQVDTIEYAYLEGDEGVYLEQREGWEIDGVEFKARLDFGVKAIDHRGLYMDPGNS